MKNRIHIVGASGSGTTTLAKEFCKRFNYVHFDTDDFFWEKTDPPYQRQRKVIDRLNLLHEKLSTTEKWVLSGSLTGWGDVLIKYFDLVVYLWIPEELRLSRLKEREKGRYGDQILEGGSMHQSHLDFINWTKKYETGGLEVRSKFSHLKWLDKLECKVIKIEGDYTLDEKIDLLK
jgi:adenylate kinase family enzyme